MKGNRTIVVDNGACTIKLGIVQGKGKVTTRSLLTLAYVFNVLTIMQRNITNAIVRTKGDKVTYVGHEIDTCHDFSSLHYRLPFEKVSASRLSQRDHRSDDFSACRGI